MEPKEDSMKITKKFLGKKTNKMHKSEETYKSDDTDNSTAKIDTSIELSSDNLLSLEEKPKTKVKIPRFDDLKIPSFLNDFKVNNSAKNILNSYNKIKEELGSPELAKLYLIDIKKLKKQ